MIEIDFGNFSAWGVTRNFFGLLLVCNQALLVLVGRHWSCWGRGFHRQDLTEEVRAAESILRAGTANFCGGKLFNSCLAALEPHTERFMKNPLRWCSVDMMMLVAALGGSGAVSFPMVDHMDDSPLRNAN